MAANVLVDTSFLVAFLNRRDANHEWAATQASKLPLPWTTCEPVLSETFHILGQRGASQLIDLLGRRALVCAFQLDNNLAAVLKFLEKYADVPMSLADACLLRMTEMLADPILFTADTDFRIYRRHSRQAVPCVMPA
jgi:predicted nucleic acid-binding protein